MVHQKYWIDVGSVSIFSYKGLSGPTPSSVAKMTQSIEKFTKLAAKDTHRKIIFMGDTNASKREIETNNRDLLDYYYDAGIGGSWKWEEKEEEKEGKWKEIGEFKLKYNPKKDGGCFYWDLINPNEQEITIHTEHNKLHNRNLVIFKPTISRYDRAYYTKNIRCKKYSVIFTEQYEDLKKYTGTDTSGCVSDHYGLLCEYDFSDFECLVSSLSSSLSSTAFNPSELSDPSGVTYVNKNIGNQSGSDRQSYSSGKSGRGGQSYSSGRGGQSYSGGRGEKGGRGGRGEKGGRGGRDRQSYSSEG